jgi:hypothetical protein
VSSRISRPTNEYKPSPKGETSDVKLWRETIQIPDYILGRVEDPTDRYFEATSQPNLGYIFRLRKSSFEADPRVLQDFDAEVPFGSFFRIECLAKGYFRFTDQWSEATEMRWGSICYDFSNATSILPLDNVADELQLRDWLEQIIGPSTEISGANLGKWRATKSLSFLTGFYVDSESPFEPWTAMFEQQFASLFAVLATQGEGSESQKDFDAYFSGYREWVHFTTPLTTPISIRHGVPEDWDNASFWARWREFGETGEILFDFWARDIDHWWLDSFRKNGLTVSVVPNGRRVAWLPETNLDAALESLMRGDQVGKCLPAYRDASELREVLLSQLELNGARGMSLQEIREELYPMNREYPINFHKYNIILPELLGRLNFFQKAEEYLKCHDLSLVLSPIRGRTIVL